MLHDGGIISQPVNMAQIDSVFVNLPPVVGSSTLDEEKSQSAVEEVQEDLEDGEILEDGEVADEEEEVKEEKKEKGEEKGDKEKSSERSRDDEERRRRRRERHRERKRKREEERNEREEKRRRRHKEKEEKAKAAPPEEDDDEMIFVRGASPVRQKEKTPPGPYDSPYQSDEEQQQHHRSEHREERYHEERRERRTETRENRRDKQCQYYLEGKCHRGSHCPYSHSGHVPKKMELCKFYMMECCAKKDKCIYMHSDFPCKFFHTGAQCYAGENCRFSHGPLNDITRDILIKHLETAPKEILGEFPRLTRESAVAMVEATEKREFGTTPTKPKPPSLFDVQVRPPLLGMAPGIPYPPPNYMNKTENNNRENYKTENNSRESSRDEERHGSSNSQYDERRRRDSGEKSSTQEKMPSNGGGDGSGADSGGDDRQNDDDSTLPAHLPKRQRELFMRIQRQQKTEQDDNEGNNTPTPQADDNWYSSDEEMESNKPANSLKLTQQSPSVPTAANIVSSLTDKISISPDVIKVLSLVKQTVSVSSHSSTKNTDVQTTRPNKLVDIDLRSLPPLTSSFGKKSDTDYRNNTGDIDLRQLPFKPVALHPPCKEIDASLNSHQPMPYRVHTVTVSKPNYAAVRQTLGDLANLADPRMRRLSGKRRSSTNDPPKKVEVPAQISDSDMRVKDSDLRRDPRVEREDPRSTNRKQDQDDRTTLPVALLGAGINPSLLDPNLLGPLDPRILNVLQNNMPPSTTNSRPGLLPNPTISFPPTGLVYQQRSNPRSS